MRSGKTAKLISFSANRCAYCPRPSFSSQSATCCIAAAPRIIGPHRPQSIPNGYSVGVEVGTCSQLGNAFDVFGSKVLKLE